MIIHDYMCRCGYEFEVVVKWDEYTAHCPICENDAKRVYKGFKGIAHEEVEWLKDTLEVVDKEGGQHCQDFLNHPSRRNYKAWMKGEGLRPMEEGEKIKRGTRKEKKAQRRKRMNGLKDKFKAREAIIL